VSTRADAWRVTPDERAGLLRKYTCLARWRRARDAHAGDGAPGGLGTGTGDVGAEAIAADPASMRGLAEEFPGALRELDLLGLPEIERRIARLTDPRAHADGEGDAEPWVAWISAYHGLMRAALAARGQRPPDPALMGAAARLGDDTFMRELTRPPGGRLSIAVLGALARRFEVPAASISGTLFPSRRRPPR